MFRTFFVFLSKAKWAQHIVMNLGFAKKMARRFIAGETLDEAINVIRSLNSKGINATLDHLGENVNTPQEATDGATEITKVIDAIVNADVKSNISIKLSQIGFNLGDKICENNLRNILAHAKEKGIFVRIDMEDTSTVDRTLQLFSMMQRDGFSKVGLVIQSYLYRSEADLIKLMETQSPIRLCKGAYKEPPDLAFPNKKDVDANYDRLTAILLDASKKYNSKLSDNGCTPPIPGIATHDEKRINFAKVYRKQISLDKSGLEFQMLHGIRRDLQESLIKEGYQVRIYVPYGTQWYPYFMRRLAERPANLWFIVSNFFR